MYVLWCKKNSIIYTTFRLKTSWWATWQLGKKSKFESVFLFAFPNTAIITFFWFIRWIFLKVIKIHNFFLDWIEPLVSIINICSTFRWLVRKSHENNFDISYRVILPLSQETDSCLILMINTMCIVCLSFPASQAKSIWVSIQGLQIVMGKPIKKCMPWHSHKWLDIDCLTVNQEETFSIYTQ